MAKKAETDINNTTNKKAFKKKVSFHESTNLGENPRQHRTERIKGDKIVN